MTPSVILQLISRSSRKAGSGVIIAITIAKTASGTAISEKDIPPVAFGDAVLGLCCNAPDFGTGAADFADELAGFEVIDGVTMLATQRAIREASHS